jgi:surface protein
VSSGGSALPTYYLHLYPDLGNVFQDTARTTAAVATDPVGGITDLSGNGFHAEQATSAARPTFQTSPGRIVLDKSDDNMDIDFGAEFTGTIIVGTLNGCYHAGIYSATGAWDLTVNPAYVPDGGTITELVAVEGTPTAGEIAAVKSAFQANGAGVDYAGVTSFAAWFRNRTDITSLGVSGWDTSAVTNFFQFVFNCSSLTALDVSLWNTAAATNFSFFALNCSSLTALDVSGWDTGACASFSFFVSGCSSLTTLDVSGWDTGACASFQSFASGCSSLTALNVSLWDTGAATNLSNFAYGCSSLTALNVSLWDTGACANFQSFAFNCSSLTALDVSGWDTSAATNFSFFVFNCSSLTTLDVSSWNTALVTNFSLFASGCSSLTTVTVSGGTGSPFSDSGCTNYANAFTGTNLSQASIDAILVAIESAGTSSGTFNQSGGNAPSATGEAAITALRGRGWTVTVTGGF